MAERQLRGNAPQAFVHALLLFAGEKVRNEMEQLSLVFTLQAIPNSRSRFLIVAKKR